MEPKVSIIVPVYNVERYLPRCLDSLVGQTLRDVEIICVDDESPDRSLSILERYAARDGRIRIISQKNKRQGGARNTGLDAARGEWVAFIDSDDWIDARYMELMYEATLRHDVDVVCCSVLKERGRRRKWNVHYVREECFAGVQEKFAAACCPPNFNTTNKLYRREALLRSGIRFREHAVYEDVAFQARTLCALGPMVTLPGPVYHYMQHGGSTTKGRQTALKQRNKYEAHREFVAFADEHGIALHPRSRSLTWRFWSFCGVTWLKIKERDGERTWRLLDLIPVWRRRVS